MKKFLQSATITTGLAIFAMLFGAGNLIFPLKVGVVTSNKVSFGLLGFILSGVLIPLAGLISMVFFDGDYKTFFYRIGKIPGSLLIFFCMLIIGPLYVMPRIVDLTYELMGPMVEKHISILIFSITFAVLTFICCYKKTIIVDLLGKILSPLKLLSLGTIIAIGLFTRKPTEVSALTSGDAFFNGFKSGYNTLDLLATIFFGYIIISILRKTLDVHTASDARALARIMLRGGLIGGTLLAIVYAGISLLGAFHGQNLNHALDAGKLFQVTLERILGPSGALFIGITVLVACLSTMIALASVVSEYLRNDIFGKKINYTVGLILVLVTTTIVAQLKLGTLLQYADPLILMGYPVLVVLTFCNIAYKLWGFKPVKLPVLAALVISSFIYGPDFIKLLKVGAPQVPNAVEIAEEPGPV